MLSRQNVPTFPRSPHPLPIVRHCSLSQSVRCIASTTTQMIPHAIVQVPLRHACVYDPRLQQMHAMATSRSATALPLRVSIRDRCGVALQLILSYNSKSKSIAKSICIYVNGFVKADQECIED